MDEFARFGCGEGRQGAAPQGEGDDRPDLAADLWPDVLIGPGRTMRSGAAKRLGKSVRRLRT